MQIKSILAAAAIALAASVGSASAADQFSTLDGVTVQPMMNIEMDQVRGGAHSEDFHIVLEIPGDVPNEDTFEAIMFVATEHAPRRDVP